MSPRPQSESCPDSVRTELQSRDPSSGRRKRAPTTNTCRKMADLRQKNSRILKIHQITRIDGMVFARIFERIPRRDLDLRAFYRTKFAFASVCRGIVGLERRQMGKFL